MPPLLYIVAGEAKAASSTKLFHWRELMKSGNEILLKVLALTIFLTFLGACQGGTTSETAKKSAEPEAAAPSPSPTAAPAEPAVGEMKTGPQGLQYQDLVTGKGPRPFLGQTLVVAYTGFLQKGGFKFDSGTIDYKPGKEKMIKGWEIAILGAKGMEPMRVGGKRKVIIPPELGYGDMIMGTIPPKSTLIFEIELVKAKGGGGFGQ